MPLVAITRDLPWLRAVASCRLSHGPPFSLPGCPLSPALLRARLPLRTRPSPCSVAPTNAPVPSPCPAPYGPAPNPAALPRAGSTYDWAALLQSCLVGMMLLDLLEAHERVGTLRALCLPRVSVGQLFFGVMWHVHCLVFVGGRNSLEWHAPVPLAVALRVAPQGAVIVWAGCSSRLHAAYCSIPGWSAGIQGISASPGAHA